MSIAIATGTRITRDELAALIEPAAIGHAQLGSLRAQALRNQLHQLPTTPTLEAPLPDRLRAAIDEIRRVPRTCVQGYTADVSSRKYPAIWSGVYGRSLSSHHAS